MTVSVRHDTCTSPTIAVVGGIDTPLAVAYLCHSLTEGVGVDDDVVVLDLSGAPGLAAASGPVLRVAATAMRRHRRWLAVVAPGRASTGIDGPHIFDTVREAAAAGRRYYKFVSGSRSRMSALLGVVRMAQSVVGVVPDLTVAAGRFAGRALAGSLLRRPVPFRR